VSKHANAAAAAAQGASPHEPPPQHPRRHQKAAEWTPTEEDPRKYASSEWLQEEKRDCAKRAFAMLMRSWPYWNHEYSRFPGLYSEWAAEHGPSACNELHAELEDTGGDPLATPAMKGARTDRWEGPLREAGLLVERCIEHETRAERKVKHDRTAGVERGGEASRLLWADEVRQPQVPSVWRSSTRTPSLGIASQTRPSAAAFRATPAPLPPKRKTRVRPAGPAAMSSHTRKLGDGGGSPYVDTDDLHGLSDDDDDDGGRWEQMRHGAGRPADNDSQSVLGRSDWLCAALSVAQGKAAAAGAGAGGAGGMGRGRGRGRGFGRDIGDADIAVAGAPQERHFRGVDQWQVRMR